MSVYTWHARVYWEDTDGGGVVYYANYLRFLERARTEWLRSLGYTQSTLAADPGVLFSVVEVNIRYRRPARLDDLLLVTCEPSVDGNASIRFAQSIRRDFAGRGADGVTADGQGELLAEATVRVASVNATTFRPCRIPPAILEGLR